MRSVLGALAVLLIAGCTTVARTGYEAATDERSLATQTADTQISAAIKKNLLESKVKGTGGLDVYCRNGAVVLAGLVEKGSQAGSEAIAIARRADGVKKVDTYFVPEQPSKTSDFAIKQKIGLKLVGDGDIKAGQVDMSVIAGHVVLVGVVNSQAKADKVVAHARATEGVVNVKSFIQIQP